MPVVSPRTAAAVALLVGVLWPAAAAAWTLAVPHTLVAHTRDGQRLPLGRLDFTPQPDGRTVAFELHLDPARFTDHFLSMKEFKCVEGGGEVVCHVPYPYASPRTITLGATPAGDDFAWLEHHLLFLFKQPREFGAKLWNGLYYRLARSGDAGLAGTPQAIDLNLISAPPAQADRPPYRPALRDDVAPGVRWIERLTIEP